MTLPLLPSSTATSEIFLNEVRTKVHVELHERRVAGVLEAMHLAGLDDKNVPSTRFEFSAVHDPGAPPVLNELDFVVGVAMRSRPGARLSMEQEHRHLHVVVGAHEVVGAAHERQIVLAQFQHYRSLPEPLSATAWRMSALNAASSNSSPSWMSIARRTFPSRLELKSPAGSSNDAPLANVTFTAFL